MTVLNALIGPVTGLLDKFIEDKDQKAALAHEIATMSQKYAQEIAQGQMAINQVEAASSSRCSVSGWRPFIGWTCGLGMFGNFITIPFSNFVLALLELDIVIPLVPLGDYDACVNGYAWSRCNEKLTRRTQAVSR